MKEVTFCNFVTGGSIFLAHFHTEQIGNLVEESIVLIYVYTYAYLYIYIYCIIHIDSTVAAVHSGPGTGSLATGLDVKHRPTGACNPTYYCWKPA